MAAQKDCPDPIVGLGARLYALWRICLDQDERVSSANKVSLPNLPIFFEAKHAIEEQSQGLEESQNCFESKIGEGFRFIDLNFRLSS